MNQDQLYAARRVAILITGFIRNDLTLPERGELDEWIARSEENMSLFAKLTDKKNILDAKKWFDDLDHQLAARKLAQTIQPQKTFLRRIPPSWIAAACLVIIIGFVITRYASRDANVYEHANFHTDSGGVIVPGTKKAILSLGNGKTIDLSHPQNSIIRINDKNQATNENSVLSYKPENSLAVMHTLRTPRGGEYQLVLPDGTRVWLNAESSLTYPTSFGVKGREVTLQGEAYFEVAHRANTLFKVVCSTTSITVLGTHFNVNAYANSTQKISLLQGSIELQHNGQVKKLEPGHQAVIGENENILVSANAHVDGSIAWTKGKFSFEKTPLTEVMQQLGRWYDVEVEYRDYEEQEFTGEIYRNSSLNEVLRMLELSTGDHFDILGKMITVRP